MKGRLRVYKSCQFWAFEITGERDTWLLHGQRCYRTRVIAKRGGERLAARFGIELVEDSASRP